MVAQQAYVEKVVHSEEKSFIRTLGQGIALFEQMTEHSKILTGEDAFKLHDTYGFPIDLTQLMAREKGLQVDVAGFDERMNEQKTRARAAGSFLWTIMKRAVELACRKRNIIGVYWLRSTKQFNKYSSLSGSRRYLSFIT